MVKSGALAGAGIIGGLIAFSSLSARSAEHRVPPEGRFLDVDGARLHYIDIGSGPVIVMIHGLTGQLRNFTYALTERLVSDYRVIVVDRPGSGYSTYNRVGGRGLDAQAAIIGHLIKALKLDQPLLVGHSLGGAIALTLATKRPELLGGLALVAPLTQPMDDAPDIFLPLVNPSPVRRAIIARTLAVPLGKVKRKRTLETVFGPDPVPADFGERGGGFLASRPSAIYAASTEISNVGDLAEIAPLYRDIALPVGILFGRGDRILDPELHGAKTAATIPGARYEAIDGGHMIPLTAPDATASWLRRQAGRVPGNSMAALPQETAR
ncbi:alpha/beta hydrolase [Sphingomonas sp. BT553]|uniref:Alpha/beta hydrolase n=1 Tax=Sphingomonas mollis TaxID=2795726 RepID=A0ABS0XVD5_9SPHN|nr:alpha/beta hydrolase [Sphingomonas sp. BT553]